MPQIERGHRVQGKSYRSYRFLNSYRNDLFRVGFLRCLARKRKMKINLGSPLKLLTGKALGQLQNPHSDRRPHISEMPLYYSILFVISSLKTAYILFELLSWRYQCAISGLPVRYQFASLPCHRQVTYYNFFVSSVQTGQICLNLSGRLTFSRW